MRPTRGKRAPARIRGTAVGAIATITLAWACSTTPSVPAGSGDTFIDDTRDAARPPATPPDPNADASDDGIYTALDAYGEGSSSTTLDLGACDTCHCAPETSYCFGGATPRGAIARADSLDGGGSDALCSMSEAGASPVVGCNAMPSGCSDCSCIIAQLQPSYACYLVCADTGRELLVYCPSP